MGLISTRSRDRASRALIGGANPFPGLWAPDHTRHIKEERGRAREPTFAVHLPSPQRHPPIRVACGVVGRAHAVAAAMTGTPPPSSTPPSSTPPRTDDDTSGGAPQPSPQRGHQPPPPLQAPPPLGPEGMHPPLSLPPSLCHSRTHDELART